MTHCLVFTFSCWHPSCLISKLTLLLLPIPMQSSGICLNRVYPSSYLSFGILSEQSMCSQTEKIEASCFVVECSGSGHPLIEWPGCLKEPKAYFILSTGMLDENRRERRLVRKQSHGRTGPNQKKKKSEPARCIVMNLLMKRNENRTLVINLIQWDCFIKKKDKTIVLKEYIQFIIFFFSNKCFYPKK